MKNEQQRLVGFINPGMRFVFCSFQIYVRPTTILYAISLFYKIEVVDEMRK